MKKMFLLIFFGITLMLTCCQSVWEKHSVIYNCKNYTPLPIVHSDEYDIGKCGLVALEQLILFYYPNKIINFSNLTNDRFHSTLELIHFAKTNDLKCELVKLDESTLLKEVKKGPVLVFVPSCENSLIRHFLKQWISHCVIVVGFSNQEIYFYSNGHGPYAIVLGYFCYLWKEQGNYVLLIQKTK